MAKFRTILQQTLGRVAPRFHDRLQRWWLCRQAGRLRRRAGPCPHLADKLDALRAVGTFRAIQKRMEILRLLELVAELRPQRLCEIGAAGGGTLFLFTQCAAPSAWVVSIDLALDAAKQRAFVHFLQPGQKLLALQADSHAPATREQVRRFLAGRPLDFLFIDGDHSYEGVRQDYEQFGPLVRPGGLIAFHDIVGDYRHRYRHGTRSDAGEVPRFWREVSCGHPGAIELVEDHGQDGFGIGVLRT